MSGERVRIELTRSGGFAALPPQRITLDTADLPPKQTEELLGLLGQVDLGGAPPGRSAVADGFRYDLSVRRGGAEQTRSFHDGEATPELRSLLALLQQHGGRG